MRKATSLIFCLICFCGLWTAQARHPGVFPHENSDLGPDPAVTFGRLDNGFRYILMPNAEPPDRVVLRLYVAAGSLMEAENQQGLAHFLEHMAFKGTENFEPGEMVEYFQRIGMAFGADTNAHTGMDETVYKIDLPENREAYLRDGLLILRDYADGMLLLEEEIESERGVILAEKRDRDSVGYRTLKARWNFLFPQTLIPQRLPIGKRAVIEQAEREQFVDFYQKWYTTDRMALVVAGDFEVAELRPLVKEFFASLPVDPGAAAFPGLGTLWQPELVAHLHSEPEAPATEISILSLKNYAREGDTREGRIEDMITAAANRALSRRFEILSRDEDAPFSAASAYFFDYLDFFVLAGIQVQCRPEQWSDALAMAERELRRALRYGFTESELNEVRANILNDYEQAVNRAPTRRSRPLADALVRSLGQGQVFTSPQQDLEIVREAMQRLSPETASAAFRKLWDEPNRFLFVSGNLALDNGAGAIKEAFQLSALDAVSPPDESIAAEWAYTDFGPSGDIKTSQYHEDLRVHQAVFDNGVRLSFKQTDYQADTVYVGVRFGGGRLAMDSDQWGLATLAEMTFINGGLKALSLDEIQRILAGRTVGIDFTVGPDAFELHGTTNAEDFLLQCQLLAAYLKAAGFREESLRMARREIPQMYIAMERTLEGVIRNQVMRFLASGNFRFGMPPQDLLQERTLDELRTWLQPALDGAYLEVAVVGDITYDAVIEALAATLGALPQRADEPELFENRRTVAFAGAPELKQFSYLSDIPRAAGLVYWPTTDMSEIETTRRLNLLANIMTDRLRKEIRDRMGEGYSPFTRNQASETYPGFGLFMAMNMTSPEQAGAVADLILAIGADLAEGTLTQDEFERAQRPLLSHLPQMRRDNGYWLNRVLLGSMKKPEMLDWARTLVESYQQMSVDDVAEVARKYLPPERAIRVLVAPLPEHSGEP